jgi:hypothetical protein
MVDTRQMFTLSDESNNPIVLVVGNDSLNDQIRSELEKQGLDAETSGSDVVVDAVIAAAPDLVILTGDAARHDGKEVIRKLSDNPAGAVVPIVVLTDMTSKDSSKAFRHGVVCTIARDTSVKDIAEQVASIVKELPERPGECKGVVEEATLDELVGLLTNELRSGVLSVKGKGEKRHERGARIVLRAGHPVTEEVMSFVERVKPILAENKGSSYEFQENSSSRVDSIAPPSMVSSHEDEQATTSLNGRRILVVDSERRRADALAKAFRDRQALAVAVCGTEVDIERACGLDPEVVIVDSSDIDGECARLIETLQKDLRMRWASVLVSSRDQVWPENSDQPCIDPLTKKIAQLNKPDDQLRKRALSNKSFDTRLEIIGPSRTLRVLAATGKTFHISVKHPRATIDIDVGNDLILGAKGFLKEADSLSVSGTTALAAFIALASGRVHVEETTAAELTDLMSPIDLMIAMAGNEAPPFRPSIPPQPIISKPVISEASPGFGVPSNLARKSDVPLQPLLGLQKPPASITSVATKIVKHMPLDPLPGTEKPRGRGNWWLRKVVPGYGAFQQDKAPKGFERAEADTQEVLIHQSLVDDQDYGNEHAVEPIDASGYLEKSVSGELTTEIPLIIPKHGQWPWKVIGSIKTQIRRFGLRLGRLFSKGPGSLSRSGVDTTTSPDRALDEKTRDAGQRRLADQPVIAPAASYKLLRFADGLRRFVSKPGFQSLITHLKPIRDRADRLPRTTKVIVGYTILSILCFSSGFVLFRVIRPRPDAQARRQVTAPIEATRVATDRSATAAAKTKRSETTLANRVSPSIGATNEPMQTAIARNPIPEVNANPSEDDPSNAQPEPRGANRSDSQVNIGKNKSQNDEADEPVRSDSRLTDAEQTRRIREADKLVTEGNGYWQQGRLGMAESCYLQALKVYPQYPQALVGLVKVHLKRGASAEAVRAAKILVQRKPQPSVNHLLLGDAYALDGDTSSARSEWKIASRRGNAEARSRLQAD